MGKKRNRDVRIKHIIDQRSSQRSKKYVLLKAHSKGEIAMAIDMLGQIPDRETVRLMTRGWLGTPYMELFGPGMARSVGIPEEEFTALLNLPEEEMWRQWERQLDTARMPSVAERVREFNQAGIRWSCLQNSNAGVSAKPIPNDHLAGIVHQHPDKLIGFAGVDPRKGTSAVREVERSINELGLKGVCLAPFQFHARPSDRLYYPIYAKCVELNVPVWINTGIHWAIDCPIEIQRPIYLDEVAIDFPELKIIAGHGGWPWINEMVAIAWKHRNIYIETSATRPKHIGTPDSGWETLIYFGNRTIQDKVVFGSEWTVLGMPIADVIAEVRALPLREEVKEKWLYHNAASLLDIK